MDRLLSFLRHVFEVPSGGVKTLPSETPDIRIKRKIENPTRTEFSDIPLQPYAQFQGPTRGFVREIARTANIRMYAESQRLLGYSIIPT